MRITIIGAAGILGRKLTARLLETGTLNGQSITALTLADVVQPQAPGIDIPVDARAVDLSSPGAAASLAAERPDVIFHLAAVVSGEAEADFDKGYRVNLDGTRALFEAVRHEGSRAPYSPRLVFTSSIVVFGEPLPASIPEDLAAWPLTSYGTQKAICELLLADYSRRGIFDGIGIRLPTISIRPGAPNRAASGFFSSILREPLIGQEAVLPVGEEVRHWFASPRAAIGFLIHAAGLDTARLGHRRTLTMPGLCASVAEAIAALRRQAGDDAVALIRREPDAAIAAIIAGWPQCFDDSRARELGFRAESSFDEIIRIHIEDELQGSPATG